MDKNADIRVVLADPVPAARSSLRMLIESSWGWRVVRECADGFEAVRVSRESHADVLLVDAAIEGLPVGEIRELLAPSGTLVVGLLERPEQHARQSGPSALKSIPADALFDLVSSQLRRHWAKRSSVSEVRR